MVIDVLMSLVCIAFGAAAAILFLVSQQAAAHVCIGSALCTAAVHMMMMNTGSVRCITICAAVLWLLGGVGMIIPSTFVSQRMFQCAAFPLMMLVFELTKMRSEHFSRRPQVPLFGERTNPQASEGLKPFLSLRGPIPDFFMNGAKKVAVNKKDCDLVADAV